MFLINSRAVHVTEIYKCLLHIKDNHRHPFYRSYGAKYAEFPQPGYTFHVLAFSARAPVLVLGTAIQHKGILFSWTLGVCGSPDIHSLRSEHYAPAVSNGTCLPECHISLSKKYHISVVSSGILTGCPSSYAVKIQLRG